MSEEELLNTSSGRDFHPTSDAYEQELIDIVEDMTVKIKSNSKVNVVVVSTKPYAQSLLYCDFSIDHSLFENQVDMVADIERRIADRYNSIREFNKEVDEIGWSIKGDDELHILSMLQLKAKRVS